MKTELLTMGLLSGPHKFISGSDAPIIMGADEAALPLSANPRQNRARGPSAELIVQPSLLVE